MAEHKATGAICPICRKPAVERLRPFCSRRCADVDLGRWLTDQYRLPVASEEAEEAEDEASPPPDSR